MNQTENNVSVLNDLIRINNDRVEGYRRAEKELQSTDADLRVLFNRMAAESTNYLTQLREMVNSSGEKPAEDTTQSGKIYRVWMDMKATFTGHDRLAILSSCEFGEDAAQRAYNAALDEKDLMPQTRQLISSQQIALKASHDEIKRLRDSLKASK